MRRLDSAACGGGCAAPRASIGPQVARHRQAHRPNESRPFSWATSFANANRYFTGPGSRT